MLKKGSLETLKKLVRAATPYRWGSTIAGSSSGERQEAEGEARSSIYVGNLPHGITDDQLYETFSQFGPINQHGGLYITYQQNSSWAFVHFLEEESAQRVLIAHSTQPLIIKNYPVRIEERFQDRAAANAVYDGDLPTSRELVLFLYRNGDKLSVGIHGYRCLNILNSQYVITLQDAKHGKNKVLRQSVKQKVEEAILKIGEEKRLLWKPPAKHLRKYITPKEHMIRQSLKHNVYRGQIHRLNWIEDATNVADQYTDPSSGRNLKTFLENFKEHLAEKIKKNPKAADLALHHFSKYAQVFFGFPIRITVKSRAEVEFGFMTTDTNDHNPIPHVYVKARGNPADFTCFLNM